MTYVRDNQWRVALPAYIVSGAAVGLLLPAMKTYAASHMGRSGYAVFFVINIALPSIIVGLAAFHPRLKVALGGTFLASVAFFLAVGLGPAMITPPLFKPLLNSLGPIATVAFVIYHLFAAGTVVVVRIWRRVGSPPDPMACTNCGYRLIGLTEPRCPECFKPVELHQVAMFRKV